MPGPKTVKKTEKKGKIRSGLLSVSLPTEQICAFSGGQIRSKNGKKHGKWGWKMRTDTYRDPWTVLVDPRFPEAVSRTKKAKNGEKRGWASIGMFEKQKKRKTSVV